MKYTVVLDFRNGISVPDALVGDVISEYIRTGGEIIIGSELLLHEIRCRVRGGYIKPDELVIVDEAGVQHTIGSSAKMPCEFYYNFASVWEDQLYSLL